MMYYIYRITNNLNNKVYIGQSVKETARWRQHKYFARQEQPIQYIHHAMKKYGIENFTYEVIVMCKNQEDASIVEKEIIKQYNSQDKNFGYNIAPGGNVTWQAGMPPHMYPMYGKHHTEEAKQKISQNNMGKLNPHSQEWSEKMSQIMTGRILTDEWKNKIARSNKNTNVGKKHSLESRKNMSLSKMGHTISLETKEKISKSKLKWSDEQYQTMISLYQSGLSSTKVAKQIGCDASTVLIVLKRFNIKSRRALKRDQNK